MTQERVADAAPSGKSDGEPLTGSHRPTLNVCSNNLGLTFIIALFARESLMLASTNDGPAAAARTFIKRLADANRMRERIFRR